MPPTAYSIATTASPAPIKPPAAATGPAVGNAAAAPPDDVLEVMRMPLETAEAPLPTSLVMVEAAPPALEVASV